MRKPIENGGPAFPGFPNSQPGMYPRDGMSLRDWFAGQAIRARWGNGDVMTADDLAALAYQLADAMLAAREARDDA